jgi:hypothetical protein
VANKVPLSRSHDDRRSHHHKKRTGLNCLAITGRLI